MTDKLKRILAAATALLLTFSASAAFADEKPQWLNYAETESMTQPAEEASQNTEADAAAAELEAWKETKRTTKVPVLLYHHIVTGEFTPEESVSLITPTDFRLHMTAIKVHFNPISLRSYYEYIMCEDGSISLPENPIIVTFDDGYLSNYEIAFPILKELEIPATIFVVTDTVGATAGDGKVNNSHFTWKQAREMEESGLIEIQSHTVNHLKMPSLDFGEQLRQFRKSKYDIEKNLGHECDMVAYPYGEYNDDLKTLAKASGYKMQLLVDDKLTEEDYDVNLPTEGTDNITRITIAGSMGNVNVIEILRQTLNKKVIPPK